MTKFRVTRKYDNQKDSETIFDSLVRAALTTLLRFPVTAE